MAIVAVSKDGWPLYVCPSTQYYFCANLAVKSCCLNQRREYAMKMNGIVARGCMLILAAGIGIAQEDPQQPERTRGQAQQPQSAQPAPPSPSLSQETVPQAQQQQ